MPSVSGNQRRAAGMALSCKRGNKKSCKGPAKEMAKMSEKQLREFARKKKK